MTKITVTPGNPMRMPLAHQFRGSADGDPLLLIAGLGSQLLFWPEGFCECLEARGFRLILVDNRDVGLSPYTPGEAPSVAAILAGESSQAPYTLDDMAVDIVLLMDYLGLEKVHLLGNSMGGMIAQTVAMGFTHRIRSLTSMMSAPDQHWLQGDPQAMEAALCLDADDPQHYVERQLEGYRVSSGPHFDEVGIRDMLERSFRRAYHPAGWGFQMQAIMASGDRSERLKQLMLPSLVIHGQLDPLIPVVAATAMARTMTNARLLLIEDMAHDLSPPHWDTVADALAELAAYTRTV